MVNDEFHYGAIVKMNFDPQAGHEQAGWRPALIVSKDTLNKHSNMIMACPITNTDRKHPFHIPLDGSTVTNGYILCEQAKMLDIPARNGKFIEDAPSKIVDEANQLVRQFLED